MKTIIEILDELAERANYVSFRSAMMATIDESTKMIEEAADIYANQSKWISVTDRLPEIGVGGVLVILEDSHSKEQFLMIANYDGDWIFPYDPAERISVAYWQYRPNNP